MALLSWQVFLLAVVVIGLGSLGYHLAHLRAIRHLTIAAEEQDRLFAYFRSLTDGAKELRLNRSKRAAFYDNVLGKSIEIVRQHEPLECRFLLLREVGKLPDLCLHRLVLFARWRRARRTLIMTGYALVFVYMVGPLEALLLNIPGKSGSGFCRAD